jgi:hypothetical protein
MKPQTRRWLKRTTAIIGASAITLVGIALTWISLQHHLGSEILETRHTNFYFVLLFIGVVITGVFLLIRLNTEPEPSEARFPSARVNVLCLMGAVLGFFCMYELIWASGSHGYSGDPFWPIEVDWAIWPPIDYFSNGEIYSWFFVVGTVLAFFTPIAGLLQLCGITIFAIDLYDIVNGPAGTGTWGASGFVLAIVSASIVLVSLAFPYGVGYKGRPIDLPGRILTISSSEFAEKIRRWRHHESLYLESTDSRQ